MLDFNLEASTLVLCFCNTVTYHFLCSSTDPTQCLVLRHHLSILALAVVKIRCPLHFTLCHYLTALSILPFVLPSPHIKALIGSSHYTTMFSTFALELFLITSSSDCFGELPKVFGILSLMLLQLTSSISSH